MRVGVGFSDNPDTAVAGRQAARQALQQAVTQESGLGPCDMVLLFATARHDAAVLREAVTFVCGSSVPVVGGGAVGAISNDRFGYAGDQVILAAVWLHEVKCDLLAEGGLSGDEEEVGRRLGKKLLEHGVTPGSPVTLFYDAVNHSRKDIPLVMATELLAGMEQGIGFLPDLIGAGLQGDYTLSSTKQWAGAEIVEHSVLALLFSGDVQVDSIIMHGCRPATGYYTVTKADKQIILEINGRPALDFLTERFAGLIKPEDFPFFLILGVNSGDKWGAFDEDHYAGRLCLGILPERNGLIMFESDMKAGTEFQIMYRSLDLDYVGPRIERMFARAVNRRPVFATYIDCAGRAAGYAGMDMEDAVAVQTTVADRVPLLGLYTGVEIASVNGRPRGLDWTGVFSLYSVPK